MLDQKNLLKKNEYFVTNFVRTEDGVDISFDHYQAGHQKVIILAHGFYNSKQAVLFQQMAKGLLDNYDVLVMDFRGHGQSGGLFSWTAKETQDLQAVLHFAQSSYSKVGVIGFSLGAAISLITAAKTSLIDSLISVSAPSAFWKMNFHFWRMGVTENIIYNMFDEGKIGKGVRPGWLGYKKTKPIDVVKNINNPLFIMHGENDWLIRSWHAEQIFSKVKTASKKLDIIPEATHAEYIFRRNKEGTLQKFNSWFEETL